MRPAALAASWSVGVVVAMVLGFAATLLVIAALPEVPLAVIGLVLTVAGVVTTILGVLAAVAVHAASARRVVGAPWWRWLVVGLPVVGLLRLVGAVERELAPVDVAVAPIPFVVTLVVELVVGGGLAVALGAWRTGVVQRRTAAAAAAAAH